MVDVQHPADFPLDLPSAYAFLSHVLRLLPAMTVVLGQLLPHMWDAFGFLRTVFQLLLTSFPSFPLSFHRC